MLPIPFSNRGWAGKGIIVLVPCGAALLDDSAGDCGWQDVELKRWWNIFCIYSKKNGDILKVFFFWLKLRISGFFHPRI